MHRDATPRDATRQDAAHRDPLYQELLAELTAPGFDPFVTDTPKIRDYYRSVIGSVPSMEHRVGTVRSGTVTIAVHLFEPVGTAPEGTVLVLHGYLSWPGEMGSMIRAFVEEGYLVVAPALPGHGLSGGEPAGIEDFSDYGRVVSDVLEALDAGPYRENGLPRPWHAVGHSTGATAVYEYVRGYSPGEPDPFQAVVFLAPLVRSAWYRMSRAGRFLARPFVTEIPSGTDHPMIPETMPLSWFDAQVRWNRRARSYPVVTRPVLVIQGDADTVVAWRYNRRFLNRKFACLRYELLRGAGHVLHGRDRAVRETTLGLTTEYIVTWPAGVDCR